MINGIEAITFDWYGTLANHRHKMGRGQLFARYLTSCGLHAAPWDRRILYAVFEYYADTYSPRSSDAEKQMFWIEFTNLLFQRSQVTGGSGDLVHHAGAIRDIFGSRCFELYSDVRPVLSALKRQGLQLAVLSNWHRGLNFFCDELQLSDVLDAVISSAEIGIEKPDPRIFHEALHLLRVKADAVVHVGDLLDDDFRGAVDAGLKAILIDRKNENHGVDNRITTLYDLERQLHAI